MYCCLKKAFLTCTRKFTYMITSSRSGKDDVGMDSRTGPSDYPCQFAHHRWEPCEPCGECGGMRKVADEAIECNRYKHTSIWNIMIKYMIYDNVWYLIAINITLCVSYSFFNPILYRYSIYIHLFLHVYT